MLRSRIRFDTRATRIETATEGGGWLFEMYKLQRGGSPSLPPGAAGAVFGINGLVAKQASTSQQVLYAASNVGDEGCDLGLRDGESWAPSPGHVGRYPLNTSRNRCSARFHSSTCPEQPLFFPKCALNKRRATILMAS